MYAGGRKRVLVAPLHWGLGHATRCIPLIRKQLSEGNDVIIAATGSPRALLQEQFTSVMFVDIPFMEITYPVDGNMVRHFFWRGPRLLLNIWREHRHLQRFVRQHSIDLVISDSRFGLWTRACRCVFVTHQVEIKSPRFQGLINVLNRWVMARYDQIWIPDYADFPGLAGSLSHPQRLPKHASYIGPLSRFKDSVGKEAKHWDTMAIISGPEPQRSKFESELARRFIESGERTLMLEGKPDRAKRNVVERLEVVHHLDDEAFIREIGRSKKVVARSGYSTIMDLHALGVESVEFHPTPGQTEQEYLAQLHQRD